MADSDLRSVIAKNITDLRKSMGLTQAELALQLNYTDKAISKWERAESMPDVTVLKGMADLFNVPINYLLEAEHSQSERAVKTASRHRTRNRIIIALLSAACVYFIVTVLYVVSGLISIAICNPSWMLYIYSTPIALTVLLVFNAIWGKRRGNLIIISMMIWSILLAVYLSFHTPNIWLVFIIGIPAQIIVILVGTMKFSRFILPRRK
jgi:transcriptional regulator with XRE-family HTH domain